MLKTLNCAVLSLVCLAGCGGMQTASSGVYREGVTAPSGEPAYITVQHCLIGFQGSVQGRPVMRSKAEAEKLAQELLARAQSGEDFAKIIVENTDDSPPGIYRMANEGFPGDMTSSIPQNQVYSRKQMVAAFGDTGFPLKVGEFGLAPYDEAKSPFGWHIVKRIR